MNQYWARYSYHADFNYPQVPILNVQWQKTEYRFIAKNDEEAIRLAKKTMDSFHYLALDEAKLDSLWQIKPVNLEEVETSKTYDSR